MGHQRFHNPGKGPYVDPVIWINCDACYVDTEDFVPQDPVIYARKPQTNSAHVRTKQSFDGREWTMSQRCSALIDERRKYDLTPDQLRALISDIRVFEMWCWVVKDVSQGYLSRDDSTRFDMEGLNELLTKNREFSCGKKAILGDSVSRENLRCAFTDHHCEKATSRRAVFLALGLLRVVELENSRRSAEEGEMIDCAPKIIRAIKNLDQYPEGGDYLIRGLAFAKTACEHLIEGKKLEVQWKRLQMIPPEMG